MPKDSPIQIPSGPLVPQEAIQAIQYVNFLLALQVKLIHAGVFSFNQQNSLIISDQGVLLPLPILWQGGVPSAGTTTVGGSIIDTVGVAISTTSATQTTPFGYSTLAQANAIVTNANALRVDVLAITTLLNQARADIITLTALVNSMLAGERSVQNLPGAAT